MNRNLEQYYAQRAKEYEYIYAKPERQKDLKTLQEYVASIFQEKSVYEIACGTGYWTQYIAKTAKEIYATDINEEVLDIAKSKSYISLTTFHQSDLYETILTDQANACFGGFIWSHIPVQNIAASLDHLHQSISHAGTCVFIDNQFVAGSNTPIAFQDQIGNTYQKRFLKDGSEHMVLKNFPSDAEFHKILASKATNVQIRRLEYFWILSYQLPEV